MLWAERWGTVLQTSSKHKLKGNFQIQAWIWSQTELHFVPFFVLFHLNPSKLKWLWIWQISSEHNSEYSFIRSAYTSISHHCITLSYHFVPLSYHCIPVSRHCKPISPLYTNTHHCVPTIKFSPPFIGTQCNILYVLGENTLCTSTAQSRIVVMTSKVLCMSVCRLSEGVGSEAEEWSCGHHGARGGRDEEGLLDCLFWWVHPISVKALLRGLGEGAEKCMCCCFITCTGSLHVIITEAAVLPIWPTPHPPFLHVHALSCSNNQTRTCTQIKIKNSSVSVSAAHFVCKLSFV